MPVDANSIRQYFRYANLDVAEYASPNFQITQEMVFELRQLDYLDQWKISRLNKWCHILLDDLSFFAFSEIGGKPSYGYYPCPLEIESIKKFLHERGVEPTQRNRAEYAEEYDLSIQTSSLKSSATPIRYDIDIGAYRPNVHPVAHLHLGLDNQIRIATRRVMTPIAFVLFVIRQTYPDNWIKLLAHRENLKLEKKLRANLPKVEDAFWKEEDELQSYLY